MFIGDLDAARPEQGNWAGHPLMSNAGLHTARIPALDGLRGVAILAVVLGHIALFGSSDHDRFNPLVKFLGANGGTGVDLFFVLSGFLITGILYASRDRDSYFSRFYARRTLRIFPVYYFALLVVAAIRIVFPTLFALHSITGTSQLANWTYTTNFLIAARGWAAEPKFLNVFWSLAVEEQFYLIWPVVVLSFGREALMRIAAAGFIAAFLIRLGLGSFSMYDAAYVLLPARMDALLLGAMISLRFRDVGELPGWVYSLPLKLGVGVVFLADAVTDQMKVAGRPSAMRYAAHFTVTSIACGLAVCLVLDHNNGNRLRSVAKSAFLRFFGKYSYAIYVFHLAVIIALPKIIEVTSQEILGHSTQVPLWIFAILGIGIATLLSLLSWSLIEKPCLDLKDKLFRNDSGQDAEPLGRNAA